MKKRKIAMILALAMILGVLAACGSKTVVPATESTAVQNESTSEQAQVPVPEAPEVDAPEAASTQEPSSAEDRGVDDSAAQMPEDYVLPLYEEPVTMDIFYPVRSGSHPSKSDEKSVFWRRLEENLGYSFTWTEPYQSAASEQFNLAVAAGDLPHIFFESLISREGSAYTGGYDVAVEEDVYLDLTPYLEEYAPHYNYLLQDPGIYNDIVTEEGRIVPFATINSETAKTGTATKASSPKKIPLPKASWASYHSGHRIGSSRA